MKSDDFDEVWVQTAREAGERGEVPDYYTPLPELKYLNHLLDQLPPVIARKRVPRMFGGVVSKGTLANADSRGNGPRGKFRVGRTVCYHTIHLLAWLEERDIMPQVSSGGRIDD